MREGEAAAAVAAATVRIEGGVKSKVREKQGVRDPGSSDCSDDITEGSSESPQSSFLTSRRNDTEAQSIDLEGMLTALSAGLAGTVTS